METRRARWWTPLLCRLRPSLPRAGVRHSRSGTGFVLAFVLILLALQGLPALAQPTTARLTGWVRDATGAIVVAAALTATEAASARAWTTATDATGTYQFPALPAGTYRVEASHQGFKGFVADGLVLAVGQVARVDVTLEVGVVGEIVEVTAERAVLRTDSTDVGVTLDDHEAGALPANGRNYVTLTLVTPGAVAPNLAPFTTGQRTTSGGRPNVNGARQVSNSFQLDGIDNNQTTDNLVAYQPSPDAIDEVTLVTGNAPAEFGNYQGALVNVTLKSGGNRLRGSVFEYFRDDALNAVNWARKWQPIDPLNPSRKTPLEHNVFGGTVGGPIVRNRLFFFGDYQGTRRRVGPLYGLLTFITPEMRRGDFSALLRGSNPQQLYDPFSARPDPANPNSVIRDPFPNNQIPLDRINPVAANLFANAYYPVPDLPGLVSNTWNRTSTTLDNDQFDVKVDAKPGARDDLSARYAWGLQSVETANAQPILMGSLNRSPFQAAVVRWARQWTPSVFNEARAGVNHIVLRSDIGLDVAGVGDLGEALGIPNANEDAPGMPSLSFGGAASGIGSSKIVNDFTTTTFQVQDTVTWQRGPHLFKGGALVVRYVQDVYFSGNSGQLGGFEFNGQYTRNLNDPRSIGSPIADFFLGYPNRVTQGDFAEKWGHRSTLFAGFVQDDWRVGRGVTLNLGLRYEYRSPFVEVEDRQVNFDLDTGEALYAGQDGNSRALVEPYRADWQPRLGVAWQPRWFEERLVLRAGYGISGYLEGTGTNLRLTLNPPYFNEYEAVNSATTPGAPISDGFAPLRPKDPLSGSVLRAWDPEYRPARLHQWHVTAESLLARDVTLTVAYVGNDGSHLAMPVNFNQAETPGGPRPFDDVYPQIASVILTAAVGEQRYDALQATLRKRFSGGWGVVGSYTLGHARSNGRGFYSDGGQTAEPATFWPDPRNPDAEWGPSGFDVRHNAAVGWVWDLPWGHDRRYLASAPRWIDALVGGWSLAGLFRGHTGFAVTVQGPDVSGTGARSARPDRVGDTAGAQEVGPGRLWFNTAAFVMPKAGTFGNAGVGIVRGPGLDVVDLSASKSVGLGGERRLQVIVEAFNLFNTPVFNAPDRTLTSGTFGEVRSSQYEREIQLGLKFTF